MTTHTVAWGRGPAAQAHLPTQPGSQGLECRGLSGAGAPHGGGLPSLGADEGFLVLPSALFSMSPRAGRTRVFWWGGPCCPPLCEQGLSPDQVGTSVPGGGQPSRLEKARRAPISGLFIFLSKGPTDSAQHMLPSTRAWNAWGAGAPL